MYLLDSNTLIYYLNAALPPSAIQFMDTVVDEHCNISAITKIETLGYNFKSPDEQKTMEAFVAGSAVLPIDDNVINNAIALRKANRIKLPDAIIAATALVYDLTFLSRNVADFKNITGLKIINPWSK